MAKRQDAHFVFRNDKSVQGHIARLTIGNDQLAQLAFDTPAHQWMSGQMIDRRTDGIDGTEGCSRVLVTQELEGPLEVIERSCRIDYLRHGFGRAAEGSATSLLIQP